MKNLGKLAVLGAALAVSSSFAYADAVSIGSVGSAGLDSGANTGGNAVMTYAGSQQFSNDNNGGSGCGGGNTYCLPAYTGNNVNAGTEAVNLNPNGVWSNALPNSSWVGINANAGPESTSNPQYGYYEFTTSFNAAGGGPYSGLLQVLADDSVEVFLNATQTQILGGATPIISFGMIGTDAKCANTAPTCTVTYSDSLSNLTLNAGANNLTFIVEQEGAGPAQGTADPSGLDFTLNVANTPEPSSLMLLGTGLTGAAGMFFRRRRTA